MIFSIQYMRAIAALMIVFHHTAYKGQVYSTNPLGWFNVGGAGVDLFFIISGYIMCHTVNAKQINFANFMLARIKRIIPLYWFLTTAALLVFITFPNMVNSSGGVTDIVNSYTLLPTQDKYLIANGWTLTYEFFFYLLFSLCLVFKFGYRFLIPCLPIIALVALGTIIEKKTALFDVITNPLLAEFIFGIAVFYWRDIITKNPKLSAVLIPIAVVLLVFINNMTTTHTSRVITYGIPALILFAGMLSLESTFKKYQANIISKIAIALGDSSYSLYLIHPFILVITAVVLSKLGINSFGNIFAILLIFSSIIAGQLCFILIEKNLSKLFIKKNKTTS